MVGNTSTQTTEHQGRKIRARCWLKHPEAARGEKTHLLARTSMAGGDRAAGGQQGGQGTHQRGDSRSSGLYPSLAGHGRGGTRV